MSENITFFYNIPRGIALGCIKLFFVLLFLGFALAYFYSYKKNPILKDLLIGGIFALISIIPCAQFLGQTKKLLLSYQNFIMIGKNMILHSDNGKQITYEYDKMQNLELYYERGRNIAYIKWPKFIIRFEYNKEIIDLTHNYEYGKVQDIYAILKSRVPENILKNEYDKQALP